MKLGDSHKAVICSMGQAPKSQDPTIVGPAVKVDSRQGLSVGEFFKMYS